ncbi:MAG: site-specific integrase [Desulfobacteraceae bacterium]|nr:MAG: site-specific integrase [Desulfobacteraceae bacterium]
MAKPKYLKSNFPGVRYREHATRKHGLKPDKYFFIRYKLDGKDKEEGLGWASAGLTETKANETLAEIKKHIREGVGHRSLAEKREAEDRKRTEEEARRKAEEEERRQAERLNITFLDVWPKYLELAKANKKPHTIYQEISAMGKWVFPVIGKKALADICTLDLERVKKNHFDAGKAPRTAQYTLAMIRQVLNFAIEHGFMSGENPSKRVKRLKFDNKRLRFLTVEEAETLLTELKKHSLDLHDIALISLHTGARAGEIFKLELTDIDFTGETITLRDTKNTETRVVFMSDRLKKMLWTRREMVTENRKNKPDGNPRNLLFPGRGGKPVTSISSTFDRVISAMGFNDGVSDRRQKMTFHCLRHTAASWLVQAGTPLFTVQKLLGHKKSEMTARYSHLAPGNLQETAKFFDTMNTTGAEIIPLTGIKQS